MRDAAHIVHLSTISRLFTNEYLPHKFGRGHGVFPSYQAS